MDVNDVIRNKMIIKKPAKTSNYKVNDNPIPQRKVKSTARNAGLYEPDNFDLSDIELPKKTSTEAQITSQIFEINGGDTFTDRSMVENWNKIVDSRGNNAKNFKGPKDNCFKKNPLMRGLLLQKMNELKLADDESSHSASGC
ncbi:uncharacterized protein LOC130675582 isoform X2 [Microplitis mediator]|uniref:uncharacterized protein LOC130675582 isoform X2 n=1 Tax=Microplitis mediator TaxID=375433 RepID=UPI002552FDD7|nr:uncharacterized protein LOC130675582 isoform X2 [Microplitis mediator]